MFATRAPANGKPFLRGRTLRCIFERNSDAVNTGARCRAGRQCLEGSESRNRLSEVLSSLADFFVRPSVRENSSGKCRQGCTSEELNRRKTTACSRDRKRAQ